jgi:hypothetical protein
MPTPQPPSDPPLWKVIVAFAAIYLIWGSTIIPLRIEVGG